MKARFEELLEGRSYPPQAYEFIMKALDYTLQGLAEVRHVSGHELTDGIRDFALSEFGPMARYVLGEWGIHQTRDFGQIVFDLISIGMLRKTEEDRLEDFIDRFDFQQVFEENYYRNHSGFRR